MAEEKKYNDEKKIADEKLSDEELKNNEELDDKELEAVAGGGGWHPHRPGHHWHHNHTKKK